MSATDPPTPPTGIPAATGRGSRRKAIAGLIVGLVVGVAAVGVPWWLSGAADDRSDAQRACDLGHEVVRQPEPIGRLDEPGAYQLAAAINYAMAAESSNPSGKPLTQALTRVAALFQTFSPATAQQLDEAITTVDRLCGEI